VENCEFTNDELNKIFEMMTTYIELGTKDLEENELIDSIWAKIINHQLGV
jgi:hypothetical protein